MIVAVTGICSKLGQTLVQKLQADPIVKKILGIDLVDYQGDQKKIEFIKLDIRDKEELSSALVHVDVLIHAAFVVGPSHLPKKEVIYDININGSINVFEAAAMNRVKKIVYLSSGAVYGYSPKNPQIVNEQSPRLGSKNKNFYYPHTKGIVEDYLDQFEKSHPQMDIVRLRAPLIVGPNFPGSNSLLKMSNQGKVMLITPTNHDGKVPFQIVHEDDLTDVIVMATRRNVRGAYNVAGDSIPDLKEYFSNNGQIKTAEVPRVLVRIAGFLSIFWTICHWTQTLLYPSMLSNDKVKRDFMWVPQYSTENWLSRETDLTTTVRIVS